MADEYIDPEISTDADALAEVVYAYIAAVVPGWVPSPGNLETILTEAFASVAADTRDIAAVVPAAIFRTFGSSVLGLTPEEPTSATITSTWTMRDASGYTIPAGTQVSIQGPSGPVPFVTTDDVLIAPGNTVTDAGAVTLESVDETAGANDLTTGAVLLDTLAYVVSIALVGASSGGSDGETDDAYLDRLSRELRLLTPCPILPNDFAVLATRIPPAFRAVAIDGYNPGDGTYNNERTVTVVAVDDAGGALSAPAKAAIEAYLEAMREVNFLVHVADPTLNNVTVASTVHVLPGYDPTEVTDAVEAATAAYLNPANWGLPTTGDQDGSSGWVNSTVVRLFEVATIIENTDGVDYIGAGTLLINGTAADHALTGVAPLPNLTSNVATAA